MAKSDERGNTVPQRRKYISWVVAAVIVALAVAGIWIPRLRYLALGFMALWLTWRAAGRNIDRRADGKDK